VGKDFLLFVVRLASDHVARVTGLGCFLLRRWIVSIVQRLDPPIPPPIKLTAFIQALDDTFRQGFMQGYIAEMYKAIKFDEVNVKGYFAWSFMDVSLFILYISTCIDACV
jgi:hypothetical protein